MPVSRAGIQKSIKKEREIDFPTYLNISLKKKSGRLRYRKKITKGTYESENHNAQHFTNKFIPEKNIIRVEMLISFSQFRAQEDICCSPNILYTRTLDVYERWCNRRCCSNIREHLIRNTECESIPPAPSDRFGQCARTGLQPSSVRSAPYPSAGH